MVQQDANTTPTSSSSAAASLALPLLSSASSSSSSSNFYQPTFSSGSAYPSAFPYNYLSSYYPPSHPSLPPPPHPYQSSSASIPSVSSASLSSLALSMAAAVASVSDTNGNSRGGGGSRRSGAGSAMTRFEPISRGGENLDLYQMFRQPTSNGFSGASFRWRLVAHFRVQNRPMFG